MADGWLVLFRAGGNLCAAAGHVFRTREEARKARDRAKGRAELSGRESSYVVAAVTVEEEERGDG